MLVVFHLHREKSLPHSIVERENRRIVENYIYHLLKFVGTFGEQEGELTCDLKLFDVLCGNPITESVCDWGERESEGER